MARIAETGWIKFILDQEFPEARDPRNYEDPLVQLPSERAGQYQALKEELESLPNDELQRRYNETHQAYLDLLRIEEEARRPFNHTKAKADHAYWSRMPLWTIREAVALSLDRDPETLDKYDMRSYAEQSAFAAKFVRQYTLIERSIMAYEIYFTIHHL